MQPEQSASHPDILDQFPLQWLWHQYVEQNLSHRKHDETHARTKHPSYAKHENSPHTAMRVVVRVQMGVAEWEPQPPQQSSTSLSCSLLPSSVGSCSPVSSLLQTSETASLSEDEMHDSQETSPLGLRYVIPFVPHLYAETVLTWLRALAQPVQSGHQPFFHVQEERWTECYRVVYALPRRAKEIPSSLPLCSPVQTEIVHRPEPLWSSSLQCETAATRVIPSSSETNHLSRTNPPPLHHARKCFTAEEITQAHVSGSVHVTHTQTRSAVAAAWSEADRWSLHDREAAAPSPLPQFHPGDDRLGSTHGRRNHEHSETLPRAILCCSGAILEEHDVHSEQLPEVALAFRSVVLRQRKRFYVSLQPSSAKTESFSIDPPGTWSVEVACEWHGKSLSQVEEKQRRTGEMHCAVTLRLHLPAASPRNAPAHNNRLRQSGGDGNEAPFLTQEMLDLGHRIVSHLAALYRTPPDPSPYCRVAPSWDFGLGTATCKKKSGTARMPLQRNVTWLQCPDSFLTANPEPHTTPPQDPWLHTLVKSQSPAATHKKEPNTTEEGSAIQVRRWHQRWILCPWTLTES